MKTVVDEFKKNKKLGTGLGAPPLTVNQPPLLHYQQIFAADPDIQNNYTYVQEAKSRERSEHNEFTGRPDSPPVTT